MMKQIPALFWRALSSQDLTGIFERDGLLTRAQTLRVWQMSGERGPPPDGRMRVVLNAAETKRWMQELLDEREREHRLETKH